MTITNSKKKVRRGERIGGEDVELAERKWGPTNGGDERGERRGGRRRVGERRRWRRERNDGEKLHGSSVDERD